MAPSFGAEWLVVPRLGRLYAAHPGTDVRVEASNRPVDPVGEDIDLLCIRYGPGRYPDPHVERLMAEAAVPVCGPRSLTGPDAPRTLADLCRQTLLHNGYAYRRRQLS